MSDIENKSAENEKWYIDDFEMSTCLGNGKFGYVYKAVEKLSQKEVAIKVLCKKQISQYNFVDQLRNEIEIQSKLK